MPKKKTDSDFTADFQELEDITRWFERGEPDLAQGLEKFTRANELAKALRERLEEADNIIKQVSK